LISSGIDPQAYAFVELSIAASATFPMDFSIPYKLLN
jgi:hypothetical protein